MVLRIAALFLALVAFALFWAWRPPFEKRDLQVRFSDGSPASGLELTWLAEGGRMGRAVEADLGVYRIHAETRAVEVLGESIADQLASWPATPSMLEVARPAELEVFVTDENGQPVSGVPLLLLPESTRPDFERPSAFMELHAGRWASFELAYAQNQSLRIALESWHAVDRERLPGEVGLAEYSDGSRVWDLDVDVAVSPTGRWCPARAETTYSRSDERGRVHFDELPLGWEGFASISCEVSPSAEPEFGASPARPANRSAPWSAAAPDGAPSIVLDVVLDEPVQRESARVVPTGSLRARLAAPKVARMADMDLGRKLPTASGTVEDLEFRGTRDLASGLPPNGPAAEIAYTALAPGSYVLVSKWSTPGPPWRSVLWLVADVSIAAGETVDLGALSVPGDDGLLVDVAWATSSNVVPGPADLEDELRLMVTVVPEDGTLGYSLPLDLSILWPSSSAGVGSGSASAAAEPRAHARVMGLPRGRVHLQPVEPYRGRNHPSVWQLDPAFGGVEVTDDVRVDLTLPLIPR